MPTNNTAISLTKDQVKMILQWHDLISPEDWESYAGNEDLDLLFYLDLAVDDGNE